METLDFEDIEEDLAIKLSDGDISAVLTCIDAVNRLKTLKLTNCINIIGVGLEPLRGSSIIEQIDLSLVENIRVLGLVRNHQFHVSSCCPFWIALLKGRAVR
eukprot:scaffold2645_cov96-Skeletonema_marinoi.AAC.1